MRKRDLDAGWEELRVKNNDSKRMKFENEQEAERLAEEAARLSSWKNQLKEDGEERRL